MRTSEILLHPDQLELAAAQVICICMTLSKSVLNSTFLSMRTCQTALAGHYVQGTHAVMSFLDLLILKKEAASLCMRQHCCINAECIATWELVSNAAYTL